MIFSNQTTNAKINYYFGIRGVAIILTSYLIRAGNSSVNQCVEIMAFDSITRETT